MRYIAPPMPIDLSIVGRKPELPGELEEIEEAAFGHVSNPIVEEESEEVQKNAGVPPRIPTHFKNESIGYQNIASMFAKKE